MARYVLKRLGLAVPMLLAITAFSFFLMHAAPGDPAAVLMDPKISAADALQFRKNLGLDRPIWVQYGIWLSSVVKGDFGRSFVTGQPVLTSILDRLPATLLLSISSLALIILITFPLGILSGAKKGSRFDKLVMMFTFIGLSIPTFWLGLVLILCFSLWLNLFPTSGWMDPNSNSVLNIGWHLCLPLFTTVLGGLAGLTRYHRSGVVMILNQDYITAARARGISWRHILFKHVFKNAALPIITILGLDLPALVSGSFVIEYIFAWPGMGQLGVASVFARDYPVIMGILMMTSVFIILGTLLSDVLYRVVDPRIRE